MQSPEHVPTRILKWYLLPLLQPNVSHLEDVIIFPNTCKEDMLVSMYPCLKMVVGSGAIWVFLGRPTSTKNKKIIYNLDSSKFRFWRFSICHNKQPKSLLECSTSRVFPHISTTKSKGVGSTSMSQYFGFADFEIKDSIVRGCHYYNMSLVSWVTLLS